MSANPKIILETILEQKKQENSPQMKMDDFFGQFTTDQLLKDFELSNDEIKEGIVDNGGDGGIDAIYTFLNGELVMRDSCPHDGKRYSTIEVFIIQSKNTNGFSESAIEKCTSSAIDLFDLSKSIDSLRSVYNNELLSNIEIFRKQYLHLASKFPILKFYYSYATKGMEVHPNVERKIENLESAIKTHFDKSEIYFDFITAQSIIDLYRREPIKTKGLSLNENPISTQDGGYIAIAPLSNYYDFITDDQKKLIRYFFDANIRDYQGKVEVNGAISETLKESDPKEDFWWLNNGITITASNATFAGKVLQIEDPQIVNGLQTSFEIEKYFTQNKIEDENRCLLVRVIKAPTESSRLKVIKATNSQTNVPKASLRATDPIHRDIEDYLMTQGFYYDRRKNYHKNHGKPTSQIISIPYLAQIVMSTLHHKPDYARARPSTLIKNDKDYNDIFNENIPIDLYHKLIILQKRTEDNLKKFDDPKLQRIEIGDIKFHVTMYLSCILTRRTKCNATTLNSIDISRLTTKQIDQAIGDIYALYDTMGGSNSVAKGKEFVREVLELVAEKNKEIEQTEEE